MTLSSYSYVATDVWHPFRGTHSTFGSQSLLLPTAPDFHFSLFLIRCLWLLLNMQISFSICRDKLHTDRLSISQGQQHYPFLIWCLATPAQSSSHTQPLSPAHPSSPKSWTGAGSDTQSCWYNGFHRFLVLTAFVTLVCLLFPNSTLGAGECASEEANFKNPRVPSGMKVAWVIPTTAHWWAVFLRRPHRKVANSTDVEV